MENKDKKYVENLLNSYKDKEVSKLGKLKELDKKVKKPALIFSIVFGTIGSLILGFGMSTAMGVILPDYMYLGIIIGLIGIFLVSINYFLYRKILSSRKKKYSNEIIELSNELLNE